MVSGFVTSPELQSWICLVDARPILIASKSLMSITGRSSPSRGRGWCGFQWADGRGGTARRAPSLLDLRLELVADVGELFVLFLDVQRLGIVEVAGVLVARQPRHVLLIRLGLHLVGRERELAVRVDAVLALLDLLGAGLARRRAQRAGREIDAQLLRGAQQLVVLLAHLDLAAALGQDVDVERQGL